MSSIVEASPSTQCLDCGNPVVGRRATRCKSCHMIWLGLLNRRHNSPALCIDCKTPIRHGAQRCRSCAGLMRRAHPASGTCIDCGIRISHYPTKRCRVCFVASQTGRPRASNPLLAAVAHPTSRDIAWAAGIFEGEGYCRFGTGSQAVLIGQKDGWVLERLQLFFGGSIGPPRPNGVCGWLLTGARARGFLMTIYSFLSPRRQEQARRALQVQIPRV